jgi:hypothetical protein
MTCGPSFSAHRLERALQLLAPWHAILGCMYSESTATTIPTMPASSSATSVLLVGESFFTSLTLELPKASAIALLSLSAPLGAVESPYWSMHSPAHLLGTFFHLSRTPFSRATSRRHSTTWRIHFPTGLKRCTAQSYWRQVRCCLV